MEELWEKGEGGVDFDSTPRIIEPEHFQCMFMILGCIFSVQLIVLLWDILTNSSFGFFKIMLGGLLACVLFTSVNLFFFSTSLWTHITYDRSARYYFFNGYPRIATPQRTISTGDYEFDMEKLANNKTVALVILGYGAVTSFIFIFVAMMRSLGNSFHSDK